MAKNPAPLSQSDAEQLDAAADQAIAACGGDAREAVKALIVANQFLETDLEKLRPARCRWAIRANHGGVSGAAQLLNSLFQSDVVAPVFGVHLACNQRTNAFFVMVDSRIAKHLLSTNIASRVRAGEGEKYCG
jgi:hypothetical protein